MGKMMKIALCTSYSSTRAVLASRLFLQLIQEGIPSILQLCLQNSLAWLPERGL